jgi:hypothetical protein
MTDADVRRAGFWRRAAAVVIDLLLVLLPLQALVMVAFLLTDGRIQGGFGALYTVCGPYDVTPEALAKLQPAPPEDANSVVLCRSGLFGHDTAATLVASKRTATTEGSRTTESVVSVSYPMNARGEFVDAVHVDILAYAALAFVVVWQWATRGRTIGGRLARVRIIRTENGGAPTAAADGGAIGWGPALKRLVLWVLMSWAFALPALVLMTAFYWLAAQSGQMWPVLVGLGLALAGLLAQIVLSLVILIDIVKRRDPLYDRWAKTAAIIG